MESKEARLQQLQHLMLEGHCAESKTAVHNSRGSIEKLMAAYWYYIREVTRKDFPSLQFLRTHFAGLTEPYGAYIDGHGEVLAQKRMVFVGSSHCQFTTTEYNVHQCWLRHNSQLEVRMAGHSHLHIDCFEESQLVLHVADEGCKAFVRLYGNSKITTSGRTECIVVKRVNAQTYEEKQ